jgi:hypothetical protein
MIRQVTIDRADQEHPLFAGEVEAGENRHGFQYFEA